MAKLRIFKSIENSVYTVIFENDPASLSQQDAQLMQKYGEPEINLGGTFLYSTADEFTLPDEYAKVRSDFPVRREFDSRAAPFDTDTDTKVNGYITEITTRFEDAFTTLRAHVDAFTGEEVVNV